MTRDEEYSLAMSRFLETGHSWVLSYRVRKTHVISFLYANEAVLAYEGAMKSPLVKDVRLEWRKKA